MKTFALSNAVQQMREAFMEIQSLHPDANHILPQLIININKNTANVLNLTCFLVFQVYKVCSDTFDIFDQHYGRGLVKDTIKDGTCNCL